MRVVALKVEPSAQNALVIVAKTFAHSAAAGERFAKA